MLPRVTSSEAVRLGEEAARRLARSGQYEIAPGLTRAEFTRIERDYDFEFADDHRAFLGAGLPLNRPPEPGQRWDKPWPGWRDGDPADLHERLAWPVEGALFDVERNGLWHLSWGQRPDDVTHALITARQYLSQAPKMVPVYTDLADYINHEFTEPGTPISAGWSAPPMVAFWSEFL